MDRTLGSLQVAALLVSASYGIGFLFGSGELAIDHGMAGSIYGVATSVGMLALACFARHLWAGGLPVWSLFGQTYGPHLQMAVALLSLVWMGGVLAAQVQGATAVVHLLGVDDWPGQIVVLVLIYTASRLHLRIASTLFALCLLASALVLVYALVASEGVTLYLHAVPAFIDDLSTFSPSALLAMSLAVGLLVCTGADYHQFLLAAKRPSAATLGCVIAGVALLAIAFLPSAVVGAMQEKGALSGITDNRQVIPWLLGRVAGSLGPGFDKLMLVALSVAALGSGAAIMRAMSSALASVVPGQRPAQHQGFAVLSLAIGAGLASRDHGIVATMVSVNVVYIASIGVCLLAMLKGTAMSPAHAGATMAIGFVVSFAVYAAGWSGLLSEASDSGSLIAGVLASASVAIVLELVTPSRTAPRSRPGHHQ